MDINKELVVASYGNNFDEVRRLIEKGADVNYEDGRCLWYCKNLDIIKFIIDKIDTSNKGIIGCLWNSIDSRNNDIYEYLFDKIDISEKK